MGEWTPPRYPSPFYLGIQEPEGGGTQKTPRVRPGAALRGAPLVAGWQRTPPPHPEDPGTCSPSAHPQHSLRRGPTTPGIHRAAKRRGRDSAGYVTRAEGFIAQLRLAGREGSPTGSRPEVPEATHRRWSPSRRSWRNGCLRSC
ncbi:hypothetical protein NN561_018446 [Cricetulus griseus]